MSIVPLSIELGVGRLVDQRHDLVRAEPLGEHRGQDVRFFGVRDARRTRRRCRCSPRAAAPRPRRRRSARSVLRQLLGDLRARAAESRSMSLTWFVASRALRAARSRCCRRPRSRRRVTGSSSLAHLAHAPCGCPCARRGRTPRRRPRSTVSPSGIDASAAAIDRRPRARLTFGMCSRSSRSGWPTSSAAAVSARTPTRRTLAVGEIEHLQRARDSGSAARCTR